MSVYNQSDLYQLLLEGGSPEDSTSSRSVRRDEPRNVTEGLQHHSESVKPRQVGDKSFLWHLIRFCGDGDLHSIHCANDFPNQSGSQLAQLLMNEDQHSFQLFVRRCGHGAPVTASDVDALNKVWKIPDYLWMLVLQGADESLAWRSGIAPERFAIMSTQIRSACINGNYLYVPDPSSGNTKSAVIFLCQSDILRSEWSIDTISSEVDCTQPRLAEPTSVVKKGVYGMLAWLANQTSQRRYATEKDFVFLCAEALLRPMILKLAKDDIRVLNNITSEGWSDTVHASNIWSKNIMSLMACQDTIRTLPSWVDDLCLEAANDQIEMRARVLRQYGQKIESLERAMDVFRQKIDLAFARTGERMASDTISETKFSKILAIIAVVYLPISIAGSIFGMNIQELNGQGVNIIWFGVTILGTLGALILCWLSFTIMTNQRGVVKDAWRTYSHDYYSGRPWKVRFWFVGITQERVRYWPTRIREMFTKLKD